MHILQRVKNIHVLELRKFSVCLLLEAPDQTDKTYVMSLRIFHNPMETQCYIHY